MKIKRLLLLFTLSWPFLLWGQVNIEFTQYQLKNGLDVILHQDNSSPVVAVNIMYHVGSKNEDPERTGFAHFFEHLMFEGTENIERGELDKLIQNAGGNYNAFTTQDITSYFEVLPSNQLKLALWIESERLRSLVIDSVGVETQRSVVKEERKARYENQPYGGFWQELFSRAFTTHPYSWVPIGYVQYIDQAQIQEFREFHDHFYVPENAVLVIAGDIDLKETKKLVKTYFGDIAVGGHDIFRPDVDEPEQTAEIRDTIYDNIQLPAVFMAYQMPAEGTHDYYVLDILANVLAGGKSSRMYKQLVDEQEIAVQTSAFAYGLEDAGLFVLYGISNFGIDAQEIEEAISEEVEKIIEKGITDKEFQKVKNQIENDFYTSNSTMEGIALSLAQYHTLYGDANLINTEIDRYMNVTKEEIEKGARIYLKEENRVVLYYLPKQQQMAQNQ